MFFGKLDIEPSINPAVLDTATWDLEAARRGIIEGQEYWSSVHDNAVHGKPLENSAGRGPVVSTIIEHGMQAFFLAELNDGQKVFLQTGTPDGARPLGEPFFQLPLGAGKLLAAYSTDARTHRQVLPPAEAGKRSASTRPRSAARDRHAHDHQGMAGNIRGNGPQAVRREHHPELGPRAQSPRGSEERQGTGAQLCQRFWHDRERVHGKHIRRALGCRRAGSPPARETTCLRSGC